MKNLATKLLILVLLISNSYLAYVVMNLDTNTQVNSEGTVIQQVVTEFSSNVTDVVENSLDKVVGISSLNTNNQVFSTGSGAIYDYDGKDIHIITNNHVVEGATSIQVTFANGESLEAKLIGSDRFTDLALLSIEADFGVEAFKLGDSSLVKVGESVLAIGSPLGLEYQGSVTMGIISGKDRLVPVDLNDDGIDDWDSIVLQTDAAINPGNSGGPLINLAGELIGITSMKIASSNVEGMGFAIPINEVVPIIEQLKNNGEVIRPLIGISAIGLDEFSVYQKSYYGIRLDLNAGLYIFNILEDSAADLGGLKEGDILLSFDGQSISNFKTFRKLLYAKKVGDTVVLEYERNETLYSTTVKLQ